MTATKTRRAAQVAPQRASADDIRLALSDFANRVLKRMEHAPRFQSLGRRQYIYVGDVAQVLDEELGGGA